MIRISSCACSPKQDRGRKRVYLEKATASFGISALIKLFPKVSRLLHPADSLFDFAIRAFDIFGYLDTPNTIVDTALDAVYEYQNREGTFANLPIWWMGRS